MENLYEILRTGAQKRMEAHSGGSEVSILSIDDDYQRRVHGNWMALILISGPSLRITFRVHFDIQRVKKVLASELGITSDDDNKSIDFVKEFCNLTAGFIKQIMEESDLSAGISLPIVTRGFDELFYTPIDSSELNDIWKIEIGGEEFVCTPSFNVFDPEKVKFLALAEEEEDDDGDIDFL